MEELLDRSEKKRIRAERELDRTVELATEMCNNVNDAMALSVDTAVRSDLARNLLTPGVSYFIVGTNGDEVFAASEIETPNDGIEIALGIERLLEITTNSIAEDYGIDLDAVLEGIYAEGLA